MNFFVIFIIVLIAAVFCLHTFVAIWHFFFSLITSLAVLVFAIFIAAIIYAIYKAYNHFK